MAARLLHLDTNVLIMAALSAHPIREDLRHWRKQGATLAVSAMAWAEFRCGPVTPPLILAWEQLLAGNIVAVDDVIANVAAELFNVSGRRSRSLPDCLIAATAIRSGARLVSLNQSDFLPLVPHGLVLA